MTLPRRLTLDRTTAGADLTAGLTVAAMLVPQAMAYALLAGLPPEVGLYAATVPLVLYALFGTSRQLAVGPVAIVSLLTASALSAVAVEGTAQYLQAAALLAVLVGAIHLVMAVGRLGFLVRLLSHPVLVGFTAAAALIIGFSQAKHLLGVSTPRTDHFHDTVWELGKALGDTHGLTIAIGAGAMALMLGLRRMRRTVPAALVAVVTTTALSAALDLESRGVRVVGDIPSGLPPVTVPSELGLVGDLLPAAAVITLVGFMESIAVARVYARRNGYAVDANRELVGLGAANVGAGLLGGYPVTGGFSRTAVNADAGAVTKAAAVVTAAVVLLVTVALTPLFTQLPQATLGAIVVLAVAKLIDWHEIRHIRSLKTSDFVTLVVAFVATLALGVELGIAASIAASAVVVFARMMTPHTAVLGRIPGTRRYRNVERYPDAQRATGVEIIRFDVSLSYLNVDFLKRRVRRLVAEAPTPPGAILVDASGVNDIDTSAVDALVDLVAELEAAGIELHLADVKGPVRDVLDRAGLTGRLEGRLHHEVDEAMDVLVPRFAPATTPADHRAGDGPHRAPSASAPVATRR